LSGFHYLFPDLLGVVSHLAGGRIKLAVVLQVLSVNLCRRLKDVGSILLLYCFGLLGLGILGLSHFGLLNRLFFLDGSHSLRGDLYRLCFAHGGYLRRDDQKLIDCLDA
jgi:hypothetical protein